MPAVRGTTTSSGSGGDIVHMEDTEQIATVRAWQSLPNETATGMHPPVPAGEDRASAAAAALATEWTGCDASTMTVRVARGAKFLAAGLGAAAAISSEDESSAARIAAIEV